MVLLAVGPLAGAGGPIRIVEDGRPRAVVVVPGGADEQTRAAAALLVRYVKDSSGAELPVVEEKAAAGRGVAIHVGLTGYAKGLGLALDKFDDDGFVIRVADGGPVVIAARTPWGAEFGICEFLERYVGVRWLMPGPDGDDVPEHKTIVVPAGEVRQEPAFFSRQFSGLSGPQALWARRNRMHARVSFHHNLQKLIAPEKYSRAHPEFFPIRGGKRYIPPDSNTHGWQPCFSAAGIVEAAVTDICRHFDAHPDDTSYSLGVVDSSGHCECQKCQAQDPPEKNFLGRRDCSDRYYDWCNRVVEGVLRKHPDKWFGCLAYSEVAQAPSRVKVHPRIIPYMTYDRMKWADPELRAEGQRMTEVWQAASPVLGWYDYIYGSAYCVPRVWFHAMGETYRYAHAHGVRAMYAEAYPNWGEGPKLYLSLKLQWDPRQNVDALLRDWYVRAVGPDAAADLADYYAHWEDFWTRRVLQSKWFTRRGQYLAFNRADYLADVSDQDIARSRELMDRVVQKAATPKQKARARLLALAFEYYEASAVAYAGKRAAQEPAPVGEADALRLLDLAQRQADMAAKRRRLVRELFPRHPELLHQIDFKRYPALSGDDWGSASIWAAFDWAARSSKVRDRLRDLADPAKPTSLAARSMLVLLDKTSQPVSKNPSFESADGKWPADWSRWVKWGTGTMALAPQAACSGKLGVLCRGLKRGGPLQTLQVPPGRYVAAAMVRVPKPLKGELTLTLSITPLDTQGANLSGPSTTIHARAGDWIRLAAGGAIPAAVDGKPVKSVRLILIVDGLQADEELHVDDLAMFRLD